MKLPSDECHSLSHWTLVMIKLNIGSGNVDPDHWRYTAPLGHNELNNHDIFVLHNAGTDYYRQLPRSCCCARHMITVVSGRALRFCYTMRDARQGDEIFARERTPGSLHQKES